MTGPRGTPLDLGARLLALWCRFACWTGNHFRPTAFPEGDAFQPVGYCRKCGKRVAQDSQGNWFRLGRA